MKPYERPARDIAAGDVPEVPRAVGAIPKELLMNTTSVDMQAHRPAAGRTVYPILFLVCITHLLNDMMQSVIPAIYPLILSLIHI